MPDSTSSSALEKIMKAVHAVERGEYNPDLLNGLEKDSGELGQLANLLDRMARSVTFRDNQLHLLRKVIPIGVSLSAEKNFNRLLETLVVEAQSVTNADAGTLYLLEDNALKFVILRNTSLGLTLGGTSGNEIPFAPVPLYHADGSENRSNVVSHAALIHKRINIADAYEAEGFDFSGTKSFDAKTKYRSKSFLTIPLENNDDKLIGVLQLINAKDPETGAIVSFKNDDALEALVLLATAALDGYIIEASLRQEIAKLKIEINESRRTRQVQEITETRYFQELRDKANQLRAEQSKNKK